MTKSPILIAFVLSLVAAAGCRTGSSLERVSSQDSQRRAPAPSPTPLPDNLLSKFDVRFLDGEIASLDKVIGQKKVVVLNFWATWCGPCRREVPSLTALYKAYDRNQLEIVGLSVEDPNSARDVVKMFAEQYSIAYRLGFASEQLFDGFSGNGRPVVPQTFVFDKSGRLVLHLRGLHPDFHELLGAAIEQGL